MNFHLRVHETGFLPVWHLKQGSLPSWKLKGGGGDPEKKFSFFNFHTWCIGRKAFYRGTSTISLAGGGLKYGISIYFFHSWIFQWGSSSGREGEGETCRGKTCRGLLPPSPNLAMFISKSGIFLRIREKWDTLRNLIGQKKHRKSVIFCFLHETAYPGYEQALHWKQLPSNIKNWLGETLEKSRKNLLKYHFVT